MRIRVGRRYTVVEEPAIVEAAKESPILATETPVVTERSIIPTPVVTETPVVPERPVIATERPASQTGKNVPGTVPIAALLQQRHLIQTNNEEVHEKVNENVNVSKAGKAKQKANYKNYVNYMIFVAWTLLALLSIAATIMGYVHIDRMFLDQPESPKTESL